MNRDKLIRVTTNVAIVSILLLVYWVFIFVSTTVFGFKVFRENLTETFYLSILGILAVLGGAMVVNVILNMSKIADALAAQNPSSTDIKTISRRSRLMLFVLSFPALFILLYLGDNASSIKKQNYLVSSAKYIANNNSDEIERIGNFSFDSSYANATAATLTRMSREYEKFPSVSVILADTISDKPAFLEFTQYDEWTNKGRDEKHEHIFSSSPEERDYLKQVFERHKLTHRFSAHDGSYELFYPVKTSKRIIILYFTDRSQYGKIGS